MTYLLGARKKRGYILTKIKVKYIGEDDVDIRNGEIYEANIIADDLRFYGVIDRSGESYAYAKKLFEIVSLDN